MPVDYGLAIAAGGLFVTTTGSLFGLGWWLSGQFRRTEKHVEEKLSEARDAIDDQIKYHERLDDERFSEIKDRLSAQDLAIMRIEFREQRMGTAVGPHEI